MLGLMGQGGYGLQYQIGGDLVAKLCPTLATPWTIACQAALSMGFSRQEYWSRLPFLTHITSYSKINSKFTKEQNVSTKTIKLLEENISTNHCDLDLGIGFLDMMGFSGSSAGKEPACQRRRCGFNPWVREDPLEEGMATHSGILAWRIPWTEQPGRVQSMGLCRVGHD